MRRSSRRSNIGVSIHQSLDSDTFTRVSTRRSSIFLTQLDDSRNIVGNFTTKFSMSSFIKKVEDLTEQQRMAVENVGFGKLLRIPHHTLRKNLLVELMERWDCERRSFVLLDRELTITPLDVALILGLRATGKPVTFSLEERFSELEEDYGADSENRKISLSSIESRLQSLGDAADDDFVRTFVLFTFGTLLFHNSNGKIDSRYLSILKDLGEVPNYAWGLAVAEDLFNWLSRRKEENVKNMEGCLILLQIWSYEHIDIGRPNLLSEPSCFPRACRWESSKSNAPRHLITTKFDDLEEDQVVWEPQPVATELNFQIIKELLVPETEGNKAVTLQSLNATTMKATRTSTQFPGLPPRSFSQRVVKDEKKKGNERRGKHDLQPECPESSCLSTDVSTVTEDYPECSSSYAMQDVEDDQVVETSHKFKEDHHALKNENSKLKKEINELRRENEVLRDQSKVSHLEEMLGSLRIKIADMEKENGRLRCAVDLIRDLKRFTPQTLSEVDVSEDEDDEDL